MKIDKYNDFLNGTIRLRHKSLYNKITKWGSSALELEKSLLSHGIKLPQKLYYEYKFPDGKTNKEYYQDKHEKWNFIVWYENNILEVKRIKPVLYSSLRYDVSDLFYFCVSLTLADNKKLKQDLENRYLLFKQELDNDINIIKKLNPELNTVQYYKNIDFLMGCMFGYAPIEIDYYTKLSVHRNERKKELKTWDKVHHEERNTPDFKHLEQLGVSVYKICGHGIGYFLAPSTVNVLEDETQKYFADINARVFER